MHPGSVQLLLEVGDWGIQSENGKAGAQVGARVVGAWVGVRAAYIVFIGGGSESRVCVPSNDQQFVFPTGVYSVFKIVESGLASCDGVTRGRCVPYDDVHPDGSNEEGERA